MEEDRKRPARKPENPVKEWISDNLRYLMLIGGIIILVVIIFFVARAIIGNGSDSSSAASVSTVSESKDESDAADEKSTSVDSSANSSEVSVTPTETPEATPTEEASQDVSLTEASADVTNVVTTYFNALSSGDASAAASVLESISDEDSAAISQGLYSTSYTDIKVYSYPGDVDGSYFVLARYNYTYPGYETAVPALTQLYVFTRDDGSLCIASDETQQTKSELFDEILKRDDVSSLVNEAKAEYDAVLAADPSLAEYINGLSS